MTKTLIIGGTGTVGGLVLAEAVRRGVDVRALVRDEKKASTLPGTVELVQGDLADRDAVRAALQGVEAAFYVSPHEENEVEIARIFGEEAQRAGVRLVFGGFHVEDQEQRAAMEEALPAYTSKLRLAAFLASTDTRPVMISITNFDQNDEVFREDVLAGRFPTPMHRDGVNRIDLRDVAVVVVNALTDPGFAAGSYQLVGPESLSGEDSARIWSEALGRPVRYTGDDPEWRRTFALRLPGRKLQDWISSFELLGSTPIPTDPADVENTARLLGRAPRSLRDYARDTAAAWR
ncbi:SDR family oxidoreductase [Umezawaea beigongshangensis]|uniref:SDR family oxidoreductase n=1 Tax=Umezawaea beigongshangensis TaxID=2780383 RepID=UPI0018F1825F|nr:NmrA family NAD(P)-binding protein [Umezawaea beigongshangensis]